MADRAADYLNKLSPADQNEFNSIYDNIMRNDSAKLTKECSPTLASNAADLAIAAWKMIRNTTEKGSAIDQTFGGPMPNPYEMARFERMAQCVSDHVNPQAIKQFEEKKNH